MLLEQIPSAAAVRDALAQLDAERRLLRRAPLPAEAKEAAEAPPERRRERRQQRRQRAA
jgi:hypothetical protein